MVVSGKCPGVQVERYFQSREIASLAEKCFISFHESPITYLLFFIMEKKTINLEQLSNFLKYIHLQSQIFIR